MAEYPKGFKGIWMKGMEAIGDTATKIASNTRYKVNEMNMVNRRREILSDFGEKAYALWQQGEQFPADLDALLRELSQLDVSLNEIRAEKAAKAAANATKGENQPAEESNEQAPLVDKADELADKVKDVLTTVGGVIGEAVDHVKEAVSGDKQPDAEEPVQNDQDAEPVKEPVPTIQVREEEPAEETASEQPTEDQSAEDQPAEDQPGE